MHIVAISDTHNDLDVASLPKGDMIIHCGDATLHGSQMEFTNFIEAYSKLPYKYKIFIPGNHDHVYFENPEFSAKVLADNPEVILLNNELITIEGFKIFGCWIMTAPNSNGFISYRYEKTMQHIWEEIPNDLDLLITHEPPYKRCDKLSSNVMSFGGNIHLADPHLGSHYLKEVVEKTKPRFHCFGHIHEGFGSSWNPDTVFINCSQKDEFYKSRGKPVNFELKLTK